MRTTVDLEEDVLLAAKEIAKQRGNTLGHVISDLARQALTRRTPVSQSMVCRYSRSSQMPAWLRLSWSTTFETKRHDNLSAGCQSASCFE